MGWLCKVQVYLMSLNLLGLYHTSSHLPLFFRSSPYSFPPMSSLQILCLLPGMLFPPLPPSGNSCSFFRSQIALDLLREELAVTPSLPRSDLLPLSQLKFNLALRLFDSCLPHLPCQLTTILSASESQFRWEYIEQDFHSFTFTHYVILSKLLEKKTSTQKLSSLLYGLEK